MSANPAQHHRPPRPADPNKLIVAYLGLGSNVGTEEDRMHFLRAALAAARLRFAPAPVRVSSPYRSAPWGITDQNEFLNAVIEIQTDLLPHELLHWAKDTECAIGRVPRGRWGPREIDIDILLMGDVQLNDAHLTIPHAYLTQRPFAAVPLLELAPNATLPDGARLADLGNQQTNDELTKLAWPEDSKPQ